MKEKIKKVLKGIGLGSLIIGGAGITMILSILHIIVVWGTGLSMVWWGIRLLIEGSIIWGLVVLFIGTPIAIAIAQFLFPFWMLFLVGVIIWTIIKLIF